MARRADIRRRPSMPRTRSPFRYLEKSDSQAISGVGYDVAVSDRTRRALGIVSGLMASADFHLNSKTLAQLREICRAHDRQNAIFSGALDRIQDNVFGSKFNFIPACDDRDLEARAEDYISKRMEKENCDAARQSDFLAMGKTALRAIINDGDISNVKRPDGSMLPFEADQIETPKGNESKKNITLGIEKNDVGAHVAYHVRQRGKTNDFGMTDSNYKSRRVLAKDVIHSAYYKRHGQTRGVPFFAAALSFGSRFTNYIDFESMQAEMNSMMGFKITKESTEQDRNNNPAGTKDNPDVLSTYEKLQKMEPGLIFELLAGEDVGMIGSTRPGENFEPYVITCCRIIGAAFGLPLELLLLDFSKTNYSSARASMGEARRRFRGWQSFLDSTFCMPWYKWQISRGIASGQLPADARLFKVESGWPAWEYTDPKKEAEGLAIEIATLIKSPQDCIRSRGRDPKKVMNEILEWNKELTNNGLEYPSQKIKINTNTKDDEDE